MKCRAATRFSEHQELQHLHFLLENQPNEVLIEANVDRTTLLKMVPHFMAVGSIEAPDPQIRRCLEPGGRSGGTLFRGLIRLYRQPELPPPVIAHPDFFMTPENLPILRNHFVDL